MQHSGVGTRKKKLALWQKNKGICHYCGVKTVLPPSGRNWLIPPRNMATLDHVYSKNDIRFNILGSKNIVVLSCLKCNEDKNEAETAPRKEYNFELFNPAFNIRDFLIPPQATNS